MADKLHPLQVGAEDIEAWLVAKDPRAIGSYRELAPEEYARAFTAAQTAGTDIAEDLYFGMVDVVSRNGSYDDFSRLVTPILKQKGWLGGDDGQIARRIELIYDTNLRLARAAGRWDSVQRTKAAFPYLRAITVGDERVRHPPKSPHADHRAFDGIILPVDHQFWASYWPPLGFRCRCAIVPMSRSQLARYKGGVTSEADLVERIARLGPPVFATPAHPLGDQLADMVAASNAPRESGGWTVGGLQGMTADEANRAIEARQAATAPRMPGLALVDPVRTESAGRALWAAVLGDQVANGIEAAIAKLFGLAA